METGFKEEDNAEDEQVRQCILRVIEKKRK